MLTMLAVRFASTTRRQTICEHSQAPRRLVSTSRVHWSSVSSRNGTIVSMPALLTRMSIGPERVPGGGDRLLHLIAPADVAGHRDGAAPLRLHDLGDRRRRRAVEVVDGDVGAFLGEHFRDAAPDATARARDERHFASEFQGALPRSLTLR